MNPSPEKLAGIREFLFPVAAERDPGFAAEIERLGRRALRLIGWVEIIMPLLGAAVWYLRIAVPLHWYWLGVGTSVALGVGTAACANTLWGSRYSRAIAVASGLLSVALGTVGELDLVRLGLTEKFPVGTTILVVLLVGVAVVPARPVHIFVLGIGGGVLSWLVTYLAIDWGWANTDDVMWTGFSGVPLFTLLCTALAASNYRRLAQSWQSQQEALRASEELRRSETRTLLAQSAAAMGRLAAAVSHDLNSPLGATKSAADSIARTADRLLTAEGPERERLARLMNTLAANITGSVDRIQAIVTRMQRFTNLDRAEILDVDIKQLLTDVAAFVSAQADGTSIRTSIGALPLFSCRPQQLSAVFSALLHQAVRRAGPEGEVVVRASFAEPNLEVSISDSGASFSLNELRRLFDPEFRVSGSRVTTANWNLFAARRMVQEAGGDIRAEQGPQGRAQFLVSLPCAVRAA